MKSTLKLQDSLEAIITIGKFQIKLLLKAKSLWKYVDGTCLREDADDTDAWDAGDAKALAAIGLNIDNSLLLHISECDSALAAWESLKAQYEDPILSNVISLRRELYHKQLYAGEDCLVHVNGLQRVADRLKGIGKPVDDLELAMVLLVSLPPSFEMLVTSLESMPSDQLTWKLVRERVLHEDVKMHHKNGSHADEKAFAHAGVPNSQHQSNSARKKNKTLQKHRGHWWRDCPTASKEWIAERNATAFNKKAVVA